MRPLRFEKMQRFFYASPPAPLRRRGENDGEQGLTNGEPHDTDERPCDSDGEHPDSDTQQWLSD